jgi:Txe/YoeB family toxin of Txe-Axe toxin-antitoxin module
MGTKFQPKLTPRFKKELDWFLDYDSAKAERIKILMADTVEHPTEGLGHSERLRHREGNWRSRHIDKKNRLVYQIIGNVVWFEQCYGHYDDH